MRKLEFKININAPKKEVWNTMIKPASYKEWAGVSWPGSTYEGTWKGGETIKFISPGQGGTAAQLTEFQEYDHLLAKHVAVVNPDGTLDTTSETAKDWIGSTERYTFEEKGNTTLLTVDIETTPDWEEMFNDGWPKALKKLKEMCEN
jgi:uncharacterized protein YndB with AHSA1/START domain